mmetsp:Transcript_36623/g.91825  ORF Transcript_36623/g.91825 Transcript_36623/m.91825 type:complete len:208 (+) Transcript_36623:556-1179(+)
MSVRRAAGICSLWPLPPQPPCSPSSTISPIAVSMSSADISASQCAQNMWGVRPFDHASSSSPAPCTYPGDLCVFDTDKHTMGRPFSGTVHTSSSSPSSSRHTQTGRRGRCRRADSGVKSTLLARRCATQAGTPRAIWSRSDLGSQSGRHSMPSTSAAQAASRHSRCSCRARLITAHQMGIVLLRLSGKLFPLRVESTTTAPPWRATV